MVELRAMNDKIRPLKNERGQMAIFIALFFQVLFVFFAMAINVGLMVHDKINLQSAADLAAYYGAGRQAQILNQMAHINYQLRQNFKLLTFRYRGIGMIGSPTNPLNANEPLAFGETGLLPPIGICVAHSGWQEYADRDPDASFCSNLTDIPAIPTVNIDSTFSPGLEQVNQDVAILQAQLVDDCLRYSVLNFNFAARILAAYRSEGLVRKEMMLGLAGLLSQPTDITDLAGGSVAQGAQRTLENNLTTGNRANVDFEFFNSMGAGGCSDPAVWLPEVRISPVLFFQDFESQGGNCLRSPGSVQPKPNRPFADGSTNLPGGQNVFQVDPTLASHWAGEPNTAAHSTLGFEKNPWCMSYVGVRATANVRKIFSPVTGTRPMTVTAFAKPFGGRMGPWYGTTWDRGANRSAPGAKTDPLVPTRKVGNTLDDASSANVDIVNFSQFPGDEDGFGSPAGLAAMATPRLQQIVVGRRRFQLDHYFHIGSPGATREYGDALARDNSALTGRVQLPAIQRELEIAAIAPDAFDISYYSIEPSYYFNYFGENTFAQNPAPSLSEAERVYDFGSTKVATEAEAAFSVQQQVTTAATVYEGSSAQALDNYKIREWPHLLTGWSQNGAVDYGYPSGRIGQCEAPASDPSFPVPGNCIAGGRVGYSVKLISKSYLQKELPLGGAGTTGTILNPPPQNFQ